MSDDGVGTMRPQRVSSAMRAYGVHRVSSAMRAYGVERCGSAMTDDGLAAIKRGDGLAAVKQGETQPQEAT